MRRAFRALCLFLFGIGVFIVLLAAMGIGSKSPPNHLGSEGQSNPRGLISVGLAFQGVGVLGYLAIAAFWRRRSRGT